MFICGRSKDDYFTGVTKAPMSEDSAYKGWKTENNMVMSWLINSMNPKTGENFMLHSTAKIWEVAKEIFSISEDVSELFETEVHFMTYDKASH